jgi:hypothetical protein
MAAAAAQQQSSALAPLPLALAQRIFVSLPVDCRARAACVCPAWRNALAEPALWTRLDLSDESGISDALNADALLRGAAGRARGQLCQLNVSRLDIDFTPAVLLAVLAASAGSLRELRVCDASVRGEVAETHNASLAAILAAAPQLQVLHADIVISTWEDAPGLLRAEAPWAPVRLGRKLQVEFEHMGVRGGLGRVAPFAAALADAARQPTLSDIRIVLADTRRPEVLDALVDGALSRRLRTLDFDCCTPPAPAPLARLLVGGALSELTLSDNLADAPLFDAAGAALVAEALRNTMTLTSLHLLFTHLCGDMEAAGVLLAALVGHPSLRELEFAEDHRFAYPAALGAALAALVAADAPALQELDISCNVLGDDGLAPLVAALPRNRHLRVLNIADNGMSDEFARSQLLPAVRANTGLHQLSCSSDAEEAEHAAEEAMELVRRRTQRS